MSGERTLPNRPALEENIINEMGFSALSENFSSAASEKYFTG